MNRIGIIGGSGLYDLEGLGDKKWKNIRTPFGRPSDDFLLAKLGGKEIVFLARHSRGHRILPSAINYRANIYGMKSLGVERIISVTACGSLKEEYRPLDFVIPSQFVDRTNQPRKNTFFDEGIVTHIGFAHPVCENLAGIIYGVVKGLGLRVHSGGTYVNIEGPQFSTQSESNLYRAWGMDIIGMTNMTEARLAREAEICYVTLAAVTDYDCWHPSHATVTVDMILDNLNKNVKNSNMILKKLIPSIGEQRDCHCGSSLKQAIVTRPHLIPRQTKKKLDIIIGKYIR